MPVELEHLADRAAIDLRTAADGAVGRPAGGERERPQLAVDA
jgi:hypothetical protein